MKRRLLLLITLISLGAVVKAQIYDTLPVIVHVIHNGEAIGTGRNISQAQVYSQFDVLNEDFRMQNADLANTPSVFLPLAGDMGLNFAKAMTDPNGNALAEPGINRVDRNAMGWTAGPYTMAYIDATIKPATVWDPTQYLNIWVLDMGTAMLSYNTFPVCPGLSCAAVATPDTSRDGIVVTHKAFGRTGNVLTPYHKGRSATYAIAQWLGLKRLQQDNCSDDCVADTPVDDYSTAFGCPSFPLTSACSTSPDGAMFMNFMSYVNDSCKTMFTQGQKARIDTVLTGGYFQSALRTSQVSVSMKEQKFTALSFYPNPTQGEINLRLPGHEQGQLEVYSLMGQKVFEAKVNGSQSISLPQSLANGAYIISLRTNHSHYTGRLFLAR